MIGSTSSQIPSTASNRSTVSFTAFLQTVRLWAVAQKKGTLTRGLLDAGSERTFITSELAQQLQCPFIRTEQVTVFTFGSTLNLLRYECRLVQLTFQIRYTGQRLYYRS